MTPHDDIRARRRKDRESGQAMVEFALILLPLLLLVAGIIQFGIGLNYWLDMNRLANQGARFAVVNSWPGCPRTQTTPACNATPPCAQAVPTNTTLPHYLECQAVSRGLENSVTAEVCAVDDGDPTTSLGAVGTPVRVRLDAPFEFVPLLQISLTLRAAATMRIENNIPDHLLLSGYCAPLP